MLRSQIDYRLACLGHKIGVLLLLTSASATLGQTGDKSDEASTEGPAWNFVSFPDFFNFDVNEPNSKWRPAVDYFLSHVKSEDPAFVLVAGDMVDGRWVSGPDQVEHLGDIYYSGWMRRMARHDLKPYTAIGDHEIGDNPWPQDKVELIPHFYDAFERHMEHPQNGPEGYLERVYAVRHRNALIITLQAYEVQEGDVVPTVGQKQLEWFEETLERHSDATFTIVQAHNPILPDVRRRSSSGIMMKGRQDSEIWQKMVEHDVDLYFAGEFHDVTAREHEGLWQVVHGASWGRGFPANYLLGKVRGDKLDLTVKEIPTQSEGGDIWNAHKPNGPSEYVRILPEDRAEGFREIGTLTIDKSGDETKFTNRTGRFTQSFDSLD